MKFRTESTSFRQKKLSVSLTSTVGSLDLTLIYLGR